jgi:two-component system cell cycle sensor histidine kinase/response regulator CckA
MSNPKKAAADSRQKPGPLIYVVDDEPMLLELAALVLEPLGYQLQTFRDPAEAMQAFTAANPRPAIVITDYAMHRLNGMDLVKQCKEIQPKQKVILVSGTVGHEVFQDAPVKPDRFLAKPYEARQLSDMVEAVLAERA